MKICFITDGGAQMGMGHVQQATTFANELRAKGEICFLTKSDDTILTMIRDSGFEARQAQSDTAILRDLMRIDPDVIVFDKIDVDERLAKDIKNTLDSSLIIFTNLTAANRHADIAVTADIGSRFENIRYTDRETGTVYYYGPKFWVLRPEFYEYKSKGKVSSGSVERILLMFGASDPLNLTSAALEELFRLDRTFQINVILGAHFSHYDAVESILQRHSERRANVTVHRNIKNVAELMHKADLAMASPGLSVFEALAVGTPAIVMPQNALQRDTYDGFMCMIERHEVGKLGGMIERAEFTHPYEDRIKRMEIGEGVAELVEVVLGSAKRSRP